MITIKMGKEFCFKYEIILNIIFYDMKLKDIEDIGKGH